MKLHLKAFDRKVEILNTICFHNNHSLKNLLMVSMLEKKHSVLYQK